MRVLFQITLVIVLAVNAAGGCSRSSDKLQPRKANTVLVESATLVVPRGPVSIGDMVPVEGTFTVTDESPSFGGIVVKVVRREREGRLVTVGTTIASFERNGNALSYRAEVPAPDKPGAYVIEVWAGSAQASVSPVDVQAMPK